ncbi:exodeoxyribonuclease V subunit gamma [Paraglaciecola sp.]|uniref:exodeoxyribonuclease V subunit gamma n=1 Tax=Paraglaciecola sp. TaxID=1920173 RepID=UPI0030F41022
MLHLIQSNKMESLAGSLIDCLSRHSASSTSLFSPDTILVQSPGMSQWLKIQIAENRGIAANLDFPLPSSFIWDLYRQHIDNLPEQSAFTKANMTWKLMSLLPTMLAQAEFSAIAAYLNQAPMLKLYQLAHKIADIYDQYLVYRPEWILAWENNEALDDTALDNKSGPDESLHPWQGVLWRALCEYSQRLGESVYHRANLHQNLLNQLRQQDEHISAKPLYVFGISAIPQQQLEVLSALAEHREVFIFWFNPSEHYWGDIVDGKTMARANLKQLVQAQGQALEPDYLLSGNPLLASWGKLGRDYQDMLLTFDYQQHDYFVETQASSMLEHIQSEVFNLQFRHSFEPLAPAELLTNGDEFPKIEIAHSDRSIQLHACHSRVRELEVLHDQLLAWFAQNAANQPGDVVVMMPDVASYAPFIEGVFGAANSQIYIPFGISDRNLSEESPLLSSFVQLMKLAQSRLTLSEVITWLAVPAVMRKFAINEQEYSLLQHWLADAGVRWGWDQKDKTRWGLPEQGQNTWLFGLQRLLAGYAMDGSQLFNYQQSQISPYADIEGQQAVALGKFYLFAQELLVVMEFCQQRANLADKVHHALDFINRLYEADEQELQDLSQLRSALEQISVHQTQCIEPIEQSVFVAELEQQLNEKGVGQRFLAGYVNFCTLMPMRSIPFKLVCLLGMNDADYPRQSVPVGFDLMRFSAAKRGDRSRRLDDRYLFMEALLSARECLYISYIGVNQKDNGELSPSILVSELLEYCEQGYALNDELMLAPKTTCQNLRQHLFTQHALQPFAAQYFVGAPRLPSYNEQALQVAITQQQPLVPHKFDQHELPALFDIQQQQLLLDGVPVELAMDDLIVFFMNPAKAFFLQRWQCRFAGLGDELMDEEPFAFGGLDKYQLNDRLISQFVALHNDGQALDESAQEQLLVHYKQQLRAEGKLPVGYSGDVALQGVATQSQALAEVVSQQCAGHKAVLVNIELPLLCELNRTQLAPPQWVKLKLNGQVKQLYGNKLILWRPGHLRGKDCLALYINWLSLCAQRSADSLHEAVFIYIDRQTKKAKTWCLAPIPSSQAAVRLNELSQLFIHGQQQILHFYPEAGLQWVNTQEKAAVLKVFAGQEGDFSFPENDEPHVRRVCPDLNEVFAEFCQLSEQIMQPMIALSNT